MASFTWMFLIFAHCLVGSHSDELTSVGLQGKGLINTSWGQRWAYAQYAPLSKRPGDAGLNERLGCESTALAQIMFFHGLCPHGAVEYTAPGFAQTGMNFSAEAEAGGLCDWDRFAPDPPNSTTAASTKAVARYIYAASLVVEKKWGTGSYMLSHSASARATEKHFGARIHILSTETSATLDDVKEAIRRDIDKHRPLKLHVAGKGHRPGAGPSEYHYVVVDGYRHAEDQFWVHLNVGHSGYDNGWYDVAKPICLKHYQNGTLPPAGGCAFNYDDVQYKQLWRIHPADASAESTEFTSDMLTDNAKKIFV